MRSCLIREHPCLCLLLCHCLFFLLLFSHPAFFYLSLPTAFPSPSPRNCGSLYTRSVAVLNVLSLLMLRSVCPRGRTTNISAHRLLFRPDIELYAARIYRSKSFCKGLRERCGRKRAKHEEEHRIEIDLGYALQAKKHRRRNTREKTKHLYTINRDFFKLFHLLHKPIHQKPCLITKVHKK